MKVDLPGVILWIAVAAMVALLIILPAPEARGGYRPLLTYRVTAEAPLELHVPPGTTLVKLIVMAEPDAPAGEGPLARLHYVLDAAWLAEDGAALGSRQISVHAGRSVWPEVVPAARAADPVLDPRTAMIEVPDPSARRLLLSVPAGSEVVRVRAFRDKRELLGHEDLALVGANARDAHRFASRLGLQSWEDVRHEEALALAQHRWQAMRPRFGTRHPVHSVITAVVDPTMPAQVRRAAGISLPPGRSIAWTLKGPVSATLLGVGPVGDLTLEGVVEDAGPVSIVRRAVAAPAWSIGADAVEIEVEAEGELSLYVHNDAGDTVRSLLLLSKGTLSSTLPSWVEAAPANALLPQGRGADALSIIAPFTFLPAWELEADRSVHFGLSVSPARDVVRLSLRVLGESRDADVTATVQAIVHYEGGLTTSQTLEEVPFTASRFERIGPTGDAWEADTWVGERELRYVHLDPGAVALEVRRAGPTRVLIGAEAPGPETGDRVSRSPQEITHLRFASATVDRWTPLRSDGSDLPTRLLWANPRHEPIPPSVPEDRERRYTMLDGGAGAQQAGVVVRGPDGTASGHVWLVPLDDEEGRGLVYCGYRPSDQARAFPLGPSALHDMGGVLSAVLWAPRQPLRLGEPWTIELDGHTWDSGRLRASVVHRHARHSPVSSVRFDAPPGSRLWLRTTVEGPRDCPEAHRPRRTVRLAPGQRMAVSFQRTEPDHLVVVGGVGEGTTTLRAVVHPRELPAARSSSESWTRRVRELELVAVESGRATGLDAPWQVTGVLQSAGLRLGPDLGLGPTTLELHNQGPLDAEIYVLLETTGPRVELRAARVPQ